MKSRTKQPALGVLLQELFHVRLLSVALNENPGMVAAIEELWCSVGFGQGVYFSAFYWKIASR